MEELTLSTAQIIPLAVFCLLVSIMGLFGNGLVVYSSVRYNTIKLDRISILFVRNLAVADILYSLITVIPLTITYFAGGYVLGDVYCFISAHLPFLPGSVNCHTVLAITAYRLRMILVPLNVDSKKFAQVAIVLIWLVSFAGTSISLGYKSDHVFVPSSAKCVSTVYLNTAAAGMFKAVTVLQIVLPVIIITIINITLLMVAYRKRRKHGRNTAANRKGYITILVLSGLFICSLTPFVIFAFLKTSGINIHPSLDLMAFHFILINVGGNPVLYTMTNKRFGKYVTDLAKRLVSCCRLGRNVQRCSIQSSSTCSSGGSVLTPKTIQVKTQQINRVVEDIDNEGVTILNQAVQETQL